MTNRYLIMERDGFRCRYCCVTPCAAVVEWGRDGW